MRRGLAGLLLGVSLGLASLTWAGFVVNHTVLDPDRSERLADQILDNETLRSALITRLSDSMASTLPAGVTIPGSQLDSIAAVALDDPRVEALVRDGIVATHQNALNGIDEPVTVNASALTEASRAALVAGRPELNDTLPQGPSVQLELPTTGLSWLGDLRSAIQRLVVIGFLLATAGATTALVIAKDRPEILRRVAFWGFGASAFWLAVSYLVPFVAAQVGPTSTAIATAMTDVLFSAMVRPALILALASIGLLVLAALISVAADRKPARVLQPPANPGPSHTKRGAAPRAGRASNVRQTAPPNGANPADPAAQPPRAADPTTVVNRPQQPTAYPGTAATQPPQSRPSAPPPQSPQSPTHEAPQRQERRWVEGVGYTDGSPDSA